MRSEDEAYFERIESELDEAFAVANEAKSRGDDPRPEVEIPVAQDMADRVENILGIDGVAERVRELEGEGSREEAALALVEDFVEGTVGDFETDAATIEGAVRTAVALLTEGVVAAPIEGIDRVEIETNDDGTEYISVYYAGPIRSAGGTAQALSVLAADYARSLLGIDEYKPRDREVKRYAEEVALYDKETGLQYSPSDAETEFIATNTPIRLDGEATGQEEVSGYRDLERVDTNSPRGGMCLVLAEGIALKAPKIQRYTRDLEAVDWPWLQDLIDGTITSDSADPAPDAPEVPPDDAPEEAETEQEGPPRAEPSGKYLRDLIAGRPVFGHPSAEGGFRLRYGRARNHGFATAGVHPATMHLVDDFLAPGTQIKTERPGKAAGVVPVDSIEGPTVKLANGDVRRVDDPAEALEIRNGVEAILDLGEYLVNFGEFVENNHPLAPASYTVEWWEQDLAAAGANVQALRDSPYVDLVAPDPDQALNWALDHDAPLHPEYTYLWHDIDVDHFDTLADAVASGTVADDRLHVPRSESVREALEVLLVEHTQEDDVLVVPNWQPLVRTLGVTTDLEREWGREDLSPDAREWENAMKAANEVAPFAVRERAPTRIGNRMGRPEKSESRDLSPAVHTLFPIGEAGGDQRNVGDAATHTAEMNDRPGHLTLHIGVRECRDCGEHTYEPRCAECGGRTVPYYECPDCDLEVEPDESGRVECPRCERTVDAVRPQTIDLNGAYHDALKAVGERENAFDILKGVKGLSSAEKVPEPLEKGILRAKHGVTTFKDGTVRYDMTDLPVTAVRPAELDVTVGQLRELGYETDVHGDPLEHPDQLVELRVQDVVLSDGAAEHMLKTADFVDELLEAYYGLDPYYEVDERDDLVGELVFGMAPHTSAAVVGRVVGFTSAAVGYAHPYFHASKRRNCFVPETKIWTRDQAGKWQHDRIETIVEDKLEEPWTDDLGTLVEELDEPIYVPSLKADGTPTIEPVSAVSKHVATDHLIEIETRSGRSLTVTPDHSMRTWENGVCELEAHQVEEGDVIPTPKSLEMAGDVPEFDLLEEFLDTDTVPNEDLMIRGLGSGQIKDIFDEETTEPGHVQSVANELGFSPSTVYNWIGRDSVPASVLEDLFDENNILDVVPKSVGLGIRSDSVSVDRMFSIDGDVATVLGYYTAEGFSRRNDGSLYQTTIAIPDDGPRRTVIDEFHEALGVEAFEENEWKVTVSSRLVAVLFTEVLGLGSRADEKRIPDAILAAPKSILRSYLAAYFSGDGSISSNRADIRATTVSSELKSDLVTALKRFGILSKVYEETRSPDTGAVAAFYRDKGESIPTFSTWVIKITSENVARFADTIGFDLERKAETLDTVLAATDLRSQRLFGDGGDVWLDEVVSVDIVESDVEYTYSLTVENTHTLLANDLFVGQCDGDEDCVMLLMDGLLNFSKAFLPDKRGGSVAEDSRLVTVDPDGSVQFMTFEEFWSELDTPVELDGKFKKKTCVHEGWQTYAFDDSHQTSLQPIEKAIRYRAEDDEFLVKVHTQFGRSLELTEHHSLFRYDDGIEEVAGAALDPGDLIVAPRRLSIDPSEVVVDAFEAVDSPYVFIDDEVEAYLRDVWKGVNRGDETRATFEYGLANRLAKSKIAREKLDAIADQSGTSPPEAVRVGLQGSSDGIDRFISVDKDFAWLLGMFVAEGSLSAMRPTIHNADETLVDQVVEKSRSALGTEPSVRWSNKAYEVAFPAVFREILYHLGFENADSYDSTEKVVPGSVMQSPDAVALSFLRGFIAGDGSQSSDDNVTTIGFHTTSEAVKDGIVFLLHRFGIVANVSYRERDPSRNPIYMVTVSGGASDNPLERILKGDAPYRPKSLTVTIPDALMKLREMNIEGIKQLIPKYLKRRENISLEKLGEIVDELDDIDLPDPATVLVDEIRPLVEGDLSYLRVTEVERVDYEGYLYDLQVGGDPVFTANWLYAHNSMDAPLVMSSRIDPAEIDDEAHNMDVVDQYPREFYEATREMAPPEDVDIAIAEETVGTPDQYRGFAFTHDTTDIALGPDLSAYKTLGSMMDKMDAQLELARKLRAVDETDVAERVIEYHFLPDLIGNLRAFSQQETRCLSCGTKYRRVPLSGNCRECGGDVNLTVHEGSVTKYMDTALEVAEEYGAREYTKQRLNILERSIESIFENDQNKQSGIADFM